jgi:hypothetical protein
VTADALIHASPASGKVWRRSVRCGVVHRDREADARTARGTIGVMPEPTNDLQKQKTELELRLQDAITQFETDTGLTVTEIVPHRLPTQDAWNQLRGLKLRIELLEKA